ncbi:MAG: glycosyltransferase [Halobacteriaceae archaeon]
MSRSVGVVLPAYRPDVERLARYVDDLHAALDPDVIRVELDDAGPAIRDRIADLPVTLHAVGGRRGKGAAVTCGFEALQTDVLAFADADGATPAASIADVVAPPCEGRADLAVGSRRHPEADVRSHQTFARRHLGDAFAWLARRLLAVGLHDYQCGAKALTVETWDAVRVHLHEPGFAFDVELVAMVGALGRRVVEVPVTWEDQPDSTVSGSTVPALARALVLSRHRAARLSGSRVHRLIPGTVGQGPRLIDRLASQHNE